RLIPQAVPRLTGATLDRYVLASAFAVSLLTALLFGVWPALSVWNTNAYDVLKDGTRTVSATVRSVRARTWLVTIELALTVVLLSSVSEGYARAIGMRVIAGRWVTDTESITAFVVNDSLARRYFPGEDPIGKRIQIGGPPGGTAAAGATFAPIVGVVADLKY